MNILIEVDLDLKRSFNQSPLKYLNEFLELKKHILTEAEYVEILTFLVEGMYDDMAAAGKKFEDEIAGNMETVRKIQKNTPEKTAELSRLKKVIYDLKSKKASVMNAIKAKYKGMYGSVKGSTVGKGVAKQFGKAKETKIGQKIVKNPKLAAAAAGVGAVAGGLTLYSNRRRKKEAAKKLGIK